MIKNESIQVAIKIKPYPTESQIITKVSNDHELELSMDDK